MASMDGEWSLPQEIWTAGKMEGSLCILCNRHDLIVLSAVMITY
jgi:hypothetical protein